MNQAGSEESPGERELRARIAAGSEELDDYLELADLLKSDGRDNEAIRTYEQVLSLRLTKIQHGRALTELGALLDGVRGERNQARTLAQEVVGLLAQEPDTVDTLLLRGLSLSKIANVTWSEDPREAESIGRLALQALERVIQESGDAEATAVVYCEAALLHSSLGDQDRAIALYQRCLERVRHPRARAEALNLLAEAFRLAGRLGEAEEAARHAVRLIDTGSAHLPQALVTLGLIQRATSRSSEAQDTLTRALEALMQHEYLRHDRELLRTIYAHLGEIDYDAGEYARAADSFRQALTHYPEDGSDRHRILIWLGDCHLAMGRTMEARPYYEEVVNSPVAGDEERQHARNGLAG